MPWSNDPAVPEDPVIGGERKLVTVLFADLVGSTALASTWSSPALVDT
jgi:class 3 adenylate cyclase